MHVSTLRSALVIGDTATFTITILNQAAVPAEDLQLQLQLPDHFQVGATSPDIPQANKDGLLQWPQQHLDPGAQAIYTLTGRLVKEPDSGALLLAAQVQARGLSLPVSGVGGALVTARSGQRGPERFVPGQGGRLQSEDGRITVELPAQASDRALSLRAERLEDAKDRLKQRGLPLPDGQVTDYPALNTFVLTAEDDAGQDVHAFQSPVTLTVRYTSEQLHVMGIAEADLELFWFDESQTIKNEDGTSRQGAWVPVQAQVDTLNHAVVAKLDHFSAYTLADGSSPSKAYMPSVQGWQVSTFTGAASYSYPIEVPAAAAGMKPKIELAYSSAATDGATGMRPKQQASWVGKGWSLDMGSIQLHRVFYGANGTQPSYKYYSMALNGQSYELVRGEALPENTSPNDPNPTHWAWHPTDDNFSRILVVDNGSSWDGNPGRGGVMFNVWQPRYTWQIWTKDGTRYEFSEDVWWGWTNCNDQEAVIETNRWMLSKVVDVHGNTMQYSYGRQSVAGGQVDCSPTRNVRGTVDQDIWLTEILWGMNPSQGETAPRYKASFNAVPRTNDLAFDTNPSNLYLGSLTGMTRETKKLQDIKIWTNATGSWELVRQYTLNYDYSLHADEWPCQCSGSIQTWKLTLTSIEQRDKNGQLPDPSRGFVTTFSYNVSPGSGAHQPDGWNRLHSIDNGQGGTITYSYNNIENLPNMNSWFRNRHRVTQVTLSDGRGNSYAWNYSYGTPNVNAIGILVNTYLKNNGSLSLGWDGMSQQPNSAPVYYVGMYDRDEARRVEREQKLTARPMTEFRGHDWVKVIDPAGVETEHDFYQGEAPCGYPKYQDGSPWGGNTILDQPCFHELAEYDMLKGREKKTVVRTSAGGPILQEQEHRFGVIRYDWGPDPLSGLYRSFRYPQVDITRQIEGSTSGYQATTQVYCYEEDQQATFQLGNRTHTLIYLGEPSLNTTTTGWDCNKPLTVSATLPYRIERQAYAITSNATTYIMDRVDQHAVFDGSSLDANGKINGLLSLKEFFFDNSTTHGSIPGVGDLTLERSYRSMSEAPMRSMDVSYGYDAWGNRTTTTTYTDWGTRSYPSYSAPGNGSTARTTTVAYDPVFHAFSLSSTNALGHVERAAYDYRMGTMTKVGGPNVPDAATFNSFSCATANINMEISCAGYDSYGRMTSVVRPGDTLASPTMNTAYADSLNPFRYTVSRKVSSASGDTYQETVQFYDGMGRKIQEKREVDGGNTRMVVSDMSYDGLDRSVAASQPRYDTSSWDAYVAPTSGLFRPTTTTYDALGRTRRITQPDGSYSDLSYSLGSLGTLTTAIDARQHKTTQESDMLGRLRQVVEYSGNAGSEGAYAAYGTTSYGYDKLDRLVQVNDALGNITSLGYDALGRKTSMNDPDMGAWSYSYHVNGTLNTQTDARPVVTTLGYDALDRLTSKSYSNGDGNRTFSYDELAGGVAKGRRTSICAYTGSSCTTAQYWSYDGRGRQTSTSQVINGTSINGNITMTYDSADRLLTQNYYGAETVTTSYDVAGRALSLCTNFGGCYVDNSANTTTYTALDQPATRKLGNGLTTTWSYNNVLARLDRLTTPTVFDRSYSYDPVGNVTAIRNFTDNQTLNYSYDHRDRLTRAWTVAGTPQAAPRLPRQAMQSQPATPPQAKDAMAQIEAALVVDQATTLQQEPAIKVPGALARPPAYRERKPAKQYAPLPLIQDNFGRTLVIGWGSAEIGGGYKTPTSNISDYSVAAGKGQLSIPASNTSREILLMENGNPFVRDADLSVRIAVDKLPTGTGAEAQMATLLRTHNENNTYRVRLGVTATGSVTLRAEQKVAGSVTGIGSTMTVSGLTATANSFIRMRVQISGSYPTTIQARAWADGSPEPTTWQLTRSDSTATELQDAGAIGLRSFLTSSVTNAPIVSSFDDLLVTTTTVAADSFTRTVSNGWGYADEGAGYSALGGNAADFSVNGSVGYFTINAANTNREGRLMSSRPARDVDITARMGTLKMPVGTGAEIRFATLARLVNADTMYRGVVRFLADGSVKLQPQKLVNGTESWIGSGVTVPGLTVAANDYVQVRVQMLGANPTILQMRAWKVGNPEPTTWLFSRTDSEPGLQQAGKVGLRTHLTSEVTNAPITTRWDDWLVTSLPENLGPAPLYDESYAYDQIGNLINKAGIVQQYGSNNNGTGSRPHAVRIINGNMYTYDNNGNLLSGGGRTLSWNAENQPTQMTIGGITESYTYDADGARVTRSVGPTGGPSLTTTYMAGGVEVDGEGIHTYYSMAGQPIAVRVSGYTQSLSYLYGDHIGSISASTNSSGLTLNRQVFDPWGKLISGNLPQTRRNFTGQYLDDSGLLFYNARYYDPGIGRFISADSIVPGNASGGMDGLAYKPLTVDFHEPAFVEKITQENQLRAWFTLSSTEKEQAGKPWGPANPQALNRYTYVLNNPMRWTDPGGHWVISGFISIRLTVLAYSIGYSGGYTMDDRGVYARTYSTSQGTGFGLYGGVGMGASISPGTKTLNDALGSGSAVGMSGGPLVVAGFDYINPGTGKDGISVSLGGGAGFEWHLEGTSTSIVPKGKGCASPHGSSCGRGYNRPRLVNKPKLLPVSPKNRETD